MRNMIDNSQYATILIVDDQPQNLHVLIHKLEAFDFSVMVAQSGEAALEQATAFPPDLILLDVMMPGGIDGFETCRRLKAQPATREIPIIFLTVLDDVLDKMQGFEIGGVDYLTKPLQQEEVLARIRAHLKIRRLQQELQRENARYRGLSEAAFEGIVIHDDARIIEINQTITTLFDYAPEELIGRPFDTFIAPDLLFDFHQQQQTAYKPFEIDLMRKDRSHFPAVIQTRPFLWEDHSLFVTAIRDITWRRELEQENLALKATLHDRYKFGEIVGKSPVMQTLYEMIAHAAASDANVLISGETGSGKELAAQTIHSLSQRQQHPFVIVNCASIAASVFEREFFGHRKGAFTGADRDAPGFFDAARKGTLFLDEIGELSQTMQATLLRAIERHEYTPVGSNSPKQANVRIIAATNRQLPELVKQGQIREDFFYRLSVLTIHIPPLRERKEDIPLLIEHFFECHWQGKTRPNVPGRILEMLRQYDWPGNVRELFNELQRYAATHHLTLQPARQIATDAGDAEEPPDLPLELAVEQFEKQIILDTLQRCHWQKARTAEKLGVNRKTLYQKMKKYGLLRE